MLFRTLALVRDNDANQITGGQKEAGVSLLDMLKYVAPKWANIPAEWTHTGVSHTQ